MCCACTSPLWHPFVLHAAPGVHAQWRLLEAAHGPGTHIWGGGGDHLIPVQDWDEKAVQDWDEKGKQREEACA